MWNTHQEDMCIMKLAIQVVGKHPMLFNAIVSRQKIERDAAYEKAKRLADHRPWSRQATQANILAAQAEVDVRELEECRERPAQIRP